MNANIWQRTEVRNVSIVAGAQSCDLRNAIQSRPSGGPIINLNLERETARAHIRIILHSVLSVYPFWLESWSLAS
jgi:hypothetical protein